MPPAAVTGEKAAQLTMGDPDLVVELPELPSPTAGGKPDLEDRTKPHPSQAAAAPPRAAFKAEGAAIGTGHPKLQGIQFIDGSPDQAVHVPLNTRSFGVETDIFKGVMQISVRGVPTTPVATGPGGPLECSRRTFHVVAQGRFKRPVAADKLMLGMEFPRPPPSPSFCKFIRFVFTGAAKVFANTTDVLVREDGDGHFYFPAFAAAESIHAARPGEEPPLMTPVEDLRLWDPSLVSKAAAGGPLAPEKRKRFFDVPANLAGRVMGTDLVWTFHLHQSLINFSNYKVGLPGVPLGIDLAPILDAQPLQIMAKDASSGSYMFDILMWNERLLYHSSPDSDDEADAAGGAVSRMKDRFKGMFSGW